MPIGNIEKCEKILVESRSYYGNEYWMWSSKLGDTNLVVFLPKSEEIQRKFFTFFKLSDATLINIGPFFLNKRFHK